MRSDGLMGRITDKAGIQFRVLNRGKGPPCAAREHKPTANSTAKRWQAAITDIEHLSMIEPRPPILS